ncbi:NUC127 domain-containing protein [Baffinella frigidus]|nr:NUC127 domain-containing protein [Cryptophyta sp. CCMP2293]
MLVLFETPAGYALFQAKDDSKFTEVDDIVEAFKSGDSANKHIKLKAFQKFEDTSEALVGTPPRAYTPAAAAPKLAYALRVETLQFARKRRWNRGLAGASPGLGGRQARICGKSAELDPRRLDTHRTQSRSF